MQEMQLQPLGQEDPLEKERATHSSNLAWEIPWTEEPGGLQSMGSQEPDSTQWLSLHTHTHCQILGKRCLNDRLNQPFNLTDGELSSGEVIQRAQGHQ